ncbi:MAG: hypothetical protein ACLRSW_12970 [Christensenellaceae bacterium]
MTNFSIQFTYPWFLLLLIPALFFSLFPYFRMAKKYRRTRNHIISVVLHTTAMVLCIFVFSGMHFDYQTINSNNEVFLLVDVSYSGRETQEKKNEFVQSVLDSGNSEYKVGIITFGYGQTYAAELSTNAEKTYESYEDSLRDNKPTTRDGYFAAVSLHELISSIPRRRSSSFYPTASKRTGKRLRRSRLRRPTASAWIRFPLRMKRKSRTRRS